MNVSLERALQETLGSQNSGVLTLHVDFGELELVVAQGRIEHASMLGIQPAMAVCETLCRAGMIADSLLDAVQESAVSVKKLRTMLVEGEYVSEWEFDQAAKITQLELLYSLRYASGIRCSFSAGEPQIDALSRLQLHPLTLVEELQALLALQGEFEETFGSMRAADVYLSTKGVEPENLTEDEAIVYGILQNEKSVADVFDVSLLGEYRVAKALISLNERNLLAINVERVDSPNVVPAVMPFPEETSQAEGGDTLNGWRLELAASSGERDDSVAVEPELNDEVEEEGEKPVESGQYQKSGDEGDIWGSFGGFEISDEMMDEKSTSASSRNSARGNDLSLQNEEEEVKQEEQKEEDGEFPAEFEPESHKWADNERMDFKGPTAWLRTLNYRLTDPANVQRGVAAFVLIFLLFLAVLLPGMIEQWFSALSELTAG